MNENRDMGFNEFLEALHKEGLMTHGITYYGNLKHLRELKKYKEMWEYFEKFHREHPNSYCVISSNDVYKALQNVKQKYFPEEDKNEIRNKIKGLKELVEVLIKEIDNV